MDIRSAAAEIRTIQRNHGTGAALCEVAFRAVNKVATVQLLEGMTVRVPDVRDRTLFDAPGFEGRFAREDELEPFADDADHELSRAFLRRAFARGDRCYALFDGEMLAAYGWYSNRPTSVDDHLVLHFSDDYTYMYKGYTARAYRGKRLHAVGMCRALQAVTDEGKTGLISWVYANNADSLRSVRRMGYSVFGTALCVRVKGLQLVYATPGCRRYGFRLESQPARTWSPVAPTSSP